jgi:hypothetical protein
VLALIAVLAGRGLPLPENVALLRLTDCELPCWIGIVPGKTTFWEAKERIGQLYGSTFVIEESATGVALLNKDDPFHTRMAVHFTTKATGLESGDKIEKITLITELTNNDSTIGALYALGIPTQVYTVTDLYATLFTNRGIWIVTNPSTCGKIGLDQSVFSFSIFDEEPDFSGWKHQPVPWRGFGRCYQ